MVLVMGLMAVFPAFGAKTTTGQKDESATKAQDSKAQQKAPAAADTTPGKKGDDSVKSPYLTIVRVYIKNSRIHVVIKNTGPGKLTAQDYVKGNLHLVGTALNRTWSLSKIDKQKSAFNRSKREIDFDTGIVMKKNASITVSLAGIEGDRDKTVTLSPSSMQARQDLPEGDDSGPKNIVPLIGESGSGERTATKLDHLPYDRRKVPLAILSPTEGDRWMRCSIQTITWSQSEPPRPNYNPSIKLIKGTYEYRISYWAPEYDADADTYSARFKVPGDIPIGSGAKVSITTTIDDVVMTRESGDVTIEENPINGITLEYPNGGEHWPRTTEHKIRWHVDGMIDAKTPWEIDLIKGGTVLVTYPHSSIEGWGLSVDPGSGYCYATYSVHSNQQIGDDYTIRVRAAGRSVSDTSDRSFSITDRPDEVDLWANTSSSIEDLAHMDYVIEPGWSFSLNYSIYNNGNRATPPFEAAFYLSRSHSAGDDAIRLAVREHEQNPDDPHRLYIGGIRLTIPEGIETGQRYFIVVVADWEDRIEEYNERNNSASQVTPIFVRAPSDANKDLEVNDLVYRSTGGYCTNAAGEISTRHVLNYRVYLWEHVFPRRAFSYKIKFYLSHSRNLDHDSPLIHTETINMPYAVTSSNPFPVGRCMSMESLGVRLLMEGGGGKRAYRYLIMSVDADNDVIELNEENNTKWIKLPLTALFNPGSDPRLSYPSGESKP
jgi:hypothetical protein